MRRFFVLIMLLSTFNSISSYAGVLKTAGIWKTTYFTTYNVEFPIDSATIIGGNLVLNLKNIKDPKTSDSIIKKSFTFKLDVELLKANNVDTFSLANSLVKDLEIDVILNCDTGTMFDFEKTDYQCKEVSITSSKKQK